MEIFGDDLLLGKRIHVVVDGVGCGRWLDINNPHAVGGIAVSVYGCWRVY